MPCIALLVTQHGVQMDILHALEEISFDVRVVLFQVGDQVFGLQSLGIGIALALKGTGVCKMAGAADELQSVCVAPFFYAVLTDEIHRADQFHAFEIRAV